VVIELAISSFLPIASRCLSVFSGFREVQDKEGPEEVEGCHLLFGTSQHNPPVKMRAREGGEVVVELLVS